MKYNNKIFLFLITFVVVTCVGCSNTNSSKKNSSSSLGESFNEKEYSKIINESYEKSQETLKLVNSFKSNKKIKKAKEIPSVDVKKYNMKLNLDTENNVLSGTVKMDITNGTKDTLKQICIRNYAASILQILDKGGSSSIFNVMDIKSGKKLNVTQKEDKSIIYIDLGKSKLKPNKKKKISLEFKTDVPNVKEKFGYHDEDGKKMYLLSFCFPIISMYENGKWNESPYANNTGEINYNKVSDFNIKITAPEEYSIIASGSEEKKDNCTTIIAKDVREMAIVASNASECHSSAAMGVGINHYYIDFDGNRKYNELALQIAEDAVSLYTNYFCKYPYEELDVVQTFMKDFNMEYPGLVMISMPDAKNYYGLDKVASVYGINNKLVANISHEIGHQWFYGIVGSDPYNEPWLDEGLTEYCEGVLFERSGSKSILNAAKYDNQSDNLINLSEKEFDKYMLGMFSSYNEKNSAKINKNKDAYKKDDYSFFVYQGGKNFLYELKNAMGDINFYYAMRQYCKTYYLKQATGENFLDIMRTYGNKEKINKVIAKYF